MAIDYYLQTKNNDGQPLRPLKRELENNLSKAIDELSGICRGILADGIVNDAEAKFFADWITLHAQIQPEWPFTDLLGRINRIFADGKVDEEERVELKEVMQMICGNRNEEELASAQTFSSGLPLDAPEPAPLLFSGRNISITGKFAYGNRKKVIEVISARGGNATDNAPTKETHLLVIGVFASRDWIHATYGRKIERAVELRSKGTGIAIIGEEHWRKFIEGS
jgi:NAD-dependent DNA ligase